MTAAIMAFAYWVEAQEDHRTLQQTREDEEQWEALMPGLIKINVDADWSGESYTDLGFGARDADVRLLYAVSQLQVLRLDPLVAEASALRWPMCLYLWSYTWSMWS